VSRSEFPNSDPFEAALRRLRSERPLQNSRLRKLASRAGKHPEADAEVERELRQHTSEHPNDAQGVWLLAQIVGRLGRPREAAALTMRCLELESGYALARWNLAKLLFNFSEFPEALRHLEILLRDDPDNPLFLQLQSDVFDAVGEGEKALVIRRRLAREHSSRADSWIGYGQALRAEGKRDDAIAAYRKAIECRASAGDAYWSLANLKTFRFSEADIAAMEQLTNRPEVEPNDRINVFFALGKAYEDRQQYARSWNYYARGNAAIQTYLRAQVTVVSETAARVAADKAFFTRAFFESRKNAGCKSREPIFILGRLRSGTTLLEQILSSHSAIEGTAELPYIRAMAKRLEEVDAPALGTAYPEVLGKLGDDAITALGKEYIERTRLHRKLGRPFFIDKNPTNYVQVGLILLILPNARIIDARRHPAASCLSIFKQNYRETNRRLSDLGQVYRDYVALMAHFDRVFPGRLHRVIYEQMVADPEREIRKVLEYLELPFEESCLHFHKTQRAVRTPSSEQVRRPISGEAVEHWRNYQPWLGPLIESLGPVFTCYPEVPKEFSH